MKEVLASGDEHGPIAAKRLNHSFRDPAGSLIAINGRILRLLTADGLKDARAFLDSSRAPAWFKQGKVVASRFLSEAEIEDALADDAFRSIYQRLNARAILEHERVWFPSFPYEWPVEMLHAAGSLNLELADDLLGEGLGLKDATPYNVLFRGPEPVFIDALSFERRDDRDPTWLAYAQFVRTFLLPLLADKYFHLPLGATLAAHRDGLDPDEVYRWLTPLQRLRPPFLSLVSLPHWLGARHDPDETTLYEKRLSKDPERSRFILRSLYRRLRRSLDDFQPRTARSSSWSNYMDSTNTYDAQQFSAKEEFVKEVLHELHPKRVLDVGCNNGHFSAIAANAGAQVVAIDSDPVVAGAVWRRAKAERLNILPLVVNLTRPTPGLGWRNQESASFLDRALGSFDTVMMLAVIHHMIVSERIPLDEIIDLAAELTTDSVILEFIGTDDSMFRRLTRGRGELHRDLTPESFLTSVRKRFHIVKERQLPNSSRHLYWLRRVD